MPYDFKTGPSGSLIAGNAVIHPDALLGRNVRVGFGTVIHAGVRIGNDVTIGDNSVIGRRPVRPGNETHVNEQTSIDDGTVIGATVVIYAGADIGKLVLIGDGAKLRERATIGDGAIVGSNVTFQRDVFMGKNSRVIDLSHITNGVIIGEGAFVSTGVLTMDDDSFNKNHDADSTLRPPTIAPFASVGGGAVLLPGVSVGLRAVVASGAVVTRDVAPGSLVMGVPAKEKHDIGYHGTPGAPSHALLHTAPAFEYEGQERQEV